jgi:VWA domain containing CoxE-like protein
MTGDTDRPTRSARLSAAIGVVWSGGSGDRSGVWEHYLAHRAHTDILIVFDTAVVDLSDQLADPVDVLFATQLGGGTDINQAVAHGQSLVTRPADTIMVLISDLIEGGDQSALLGRLTALVDSGVRLIVLLALSDDGAPAYSHELAAACSALGAPAFSWTPDQFPELLAHAIRREDVAAWVARNGPADAAG